VTGILIPNSCTKGGIGLNVPEVRMMHRVPCIQSIFILRDTLHCIKFAQYFKLKLPKGRTKAPIVQDASFFGAIGLFGIQPGIFFILIGILQCDVQL
jgi:hypothetical protein